MFEGLTTFGPIAAIVAFWQQFQSFLRRFTSLAIVSIDIRDGELSQILMSYIWDHFRVSRFGTKAYLARNVFVRPLEHYEMVPFETIGAVMTVWKGWRPMFLSQASEKNSGWFVKVTYLRGLFNFPTLLLAAADYQNHRLREANGTRRFYVEKLFGTFSRSYRRGGGDQSSDMPSNDSAKAQAETRGIPGERPLRWTVNDFGVLSPEAPFSFLAYSPEVEALKELVIRWKKSEAWYKGKGLDWRFGVGLYGKAGTGKTSFVRAIGQLLDLPIFVFDLTSMNNQELVRHWKRIQNQTPCVALFEDMDRLFDRDRKFLASQDSGLTLDSLLNCISGAEPANGILTVMTANDITKLDPALGVPDETMQSTRPGRLDRLVEFTVLSDESRRIVAHRILSEFTPEEQAAVLKAGAGETGAQFTKRCELLAIERYWNPPNKEAKA